MALNELLVPLNDEQGQVATLLRQLQQLTPRVLALLREYDEQGRGQVALPEFRGALAALGITASPAVVAKLFDEVDRDRSGAIDMREMEVALRERAAASHRRGGHASRGQGGRGGAIRVAQGAREHEGAAGDAAARRPRSGAQGRSGESAGR